jgi:hypothetical protein
MTTSTLKTTMETTPQSNRIQTPAEAPGAPSRPRKRRNAEGDEDVHVHFVETKVYRSGHVESTSGRRFFKRRLELVCDLDAMSQEYLNYKLLHDLENTGMAVRTAKYDYDDNLTFHQLILIKIT